MVRGVWCKSGVVRGGNIIPMLRWHPHNTKNKEKDRLRREDGSMRTSAR